MRAHNTVKRCWAISDGRTGNERQAVALAHALGLNPQIMQLRIPSPWSWLAPRLTIGAKGAIKFDNGDLPEPPWPDIAIGCGRRAALLTRLLRGWSAKRCFTVQILDPHVNPTLFDLVIAPQHDRLFGDNVIRTIGSLHPVNLSWLIQARDQFNTLAHFPKPHTTVLIGGSTRKQYLDGAYFQALLEQLTRLHARDGGSFFVSTSRRTPIELITFLRTAFNPFPGRFWANDTDGENPYAGFLAHADRLVVTPDSVNMLSEACAIGRPVYTFCLRPPRGKLGRFHARLIAEGHLQQLANANRQMISMPLLETTAVAELVRNYWHTAIPPQY